MLTHCKNGHEFTDDNTYIKPSGHRQCRTCQRAAVARYTARRASVSREVGVAS